MADSTNPIPQVVAGAGAAQRVNDLFAAASPAIVYAMDFTTTTGLVWGYLGGGGPFSSAAISNGTVSLTASATNYIVASRSTGAVSASTATTNWNDTDNFARVAQVVTGSSSITSYLDWRFRPGGTHTSSSSPSGGGGATPALQFIADLSSTSDADPGPGKLRWNNATPTASTVLYIDEQTADGASLSSVWAEISPGSSLFVQHATDQSVWQWWRISSTTAATGYRKLSVSLLASRGSISNNDDIYLSFDLKGGGGGGTQCIAIACSDETSALTVGAAKATFRMPFGFALSSVRASLTAAQSSGSTFTVDINSNGSSILSTRITIDNGSRTSVTATVPPVISNASLASDAEITIDIDQVGNGTATGLKVYLIGTPA